MDLYRAQLRTLIQATQIFSPTAYSWFGTRAPELPRAVKRAMTAATARSYLLFSLQSQFYNNFYCTGRAVPAGREPIGAPVWGLTPFVERLSKANAGHGHWESGWEARAVGTGELVVHKDGLELRARRDCCLLPEGVSMADGTPLSVRLPKDFLGMSPGFYFALGNEELSQEDLQSLVRWYFNATAEGAVHLMQGATSRLNGADIPFKLKVLNDPARFTRCDAAVLYTRKNDYQAAIAILEDLYPQLSPHLKEDTPAFTKPLAPGFGLAEDPGQGYSFGLHRCGIVAEGLVRAHERGRQAADDRLQFVSDCFDEAGISFEKPFLQRGSDDGYGSPLRRSKQPARSANTAPGAGAEIEPFLQTARDIGRRLVQQAVWHENRCTWIGAESSVHGVARGVSRIKYRTLGPELYSGTTGVALFLAELFNLTGEAELRRTALGAIKQALARGDRVLPRVRLGLYTGWAGMALAVARIGVIFGDEELLSSARRLLRDLMREDQDECECDLLSGKAGAIAALVALRDIVDDRSVLEFAVQLGDGLVRAADQDNTGCSWKTTTFPVRRNLTGLSHGAAGVAHALLELFRETGHSQYLTVAERAFDYERYWFDGGAGNWPDFREESGQGPQNKEALSFAATWCHGAPGIALSRLRAHEILHDDRCRTEAIIGLRTTRKTIETWLDSGGANYSLCHGLAGNAEILLYGHQVLGEQLEEERELGIMVARRGMKMFAETGHHWPCGTGGGDSASLMLGLAGIGYFYLRLHSPGTPSLTLVTRSRPARFAQAVAAYQ